MAMMVLSRSKKAASKSLTFSHLPNRAGQGVTHVTPCLAQGIHRGFMTALHIAIVSRDPKIRLAAARAFDHAPPSWSVSLYTEPPPGADVVVLGPDARGAGIPFDPLAPGRVIADIEASRAAQTGPVVAVVGASRGAGATTLALHLACALAPLCRVGFVDLAGGAALRLGLEPGEHLTWAGLEDDSDSTTRCALPVEGGFRALLAPPEGGDAQLVLKRATGAFELVVVDVSPEVAPAVLSDVDAAVLVCAPTVPGARRAMTLLEEWGDLDWAIVTNRVGPGGETTRSQLAGILGRPIAIELPCSAALRDAEDDGRLVSLVWNRYGRAVARLARALVSA